MSRLLAFTGLIAALALAACAPAAPSPAVLPTFLPQQGLATPDINAAYPTVAAAESNTSQTVSGFSLNLQRAARWKTSLCGCLLHSAGRLGLDNLGRTLRIRRAGNFRIQLLHAEQARGRERAAGSALR